MENTLDNGKVRISVSSRGGELCSISANGLEYLWNGDAEYWSSHAPTLFPICGSLRANKAETKDGKKLAMGRHGIVRKREFTLEQADSEKIVYSIAASDETKAEYPFDFKLTTSYELEDSAVKITYRVDNNDSAPLPFALGFHPAFNCPIVGAGDSYEDYSVKLAQAETLDVPTQLVETGMLDTTQRTPLFDDTDTLSLDYSLFAVDAITLDTLKSRSIKLVSKKHDHGVEIAFDGFNNIILWSTTNKSPFIAIEPWTALSTTTTESDYIEDKKNITILEPGKSAEFSITVRVF